MLLRYIMTFAIVALTSCGGSLIYLTAKPAQLAFIPDRTELSGEVKDIKTQMNAYRLAITPDDDYETDAENCSTHEELKPYEDGKEVFTEIKPAAPITLKLVWKVPQKTRNRRSFRRGLIRFTNLRLTDEVEIVDPLDKIYFEGLLFSRK